MEKKKKCFLFHRWTEWIAHSMKLYNKKTGLHYKITIHERACMNCFKVKAKLKK